MSGEVPFAALAAAGLPGVARARPLSGGCMHHARMVELTDGRVIAAKSGAASAGALFAEEAAGLAALASTGTVLVPEVLHEGVHDGVAVLLLSFIEPASPSAQGWATLGRDLAMLHAAPAGDRYGFDHDNHLGLTPQPNTWSDDWVEFNRVHRLGQQVRLARDGGRLAAGEATRLDHLVDRLDAIVPRDPRPSLLHGDLWSGNALPTAGGRVAVIDPAVSIGDGWADIAMMRLFGGFPAACFEAYAEAAGGTPDAIERRIAVYQLYHLLNHLNLFGRGYAGQVMAVAGSI